MERFGEQPIYNEHLDRVDIDGALKKAEKILSDPIDPEDFRDIYGENVDRDIAYVADMEEKFELNKHESPQSERNEERAKIAKIFEAIVFQHAELSNWFGESAQTVQASRFDDIANGVDTIVEFEDGNSAHHLALAVDVTTSRTILEKFDRIRTEIDAGKLTEIKYFVSEKLDLRGHKANVPRVVIGADRQTIYNVVNAWLAEDKKALAEHPIQIKILMEIDAQLKAFKTYCETIGAHDLATVYEKGIRIIGEIMEQKSPTPEQLSELDIDEVYSAIKNNSEMIARTNPLKP
ncbi:MAG: hypothetical protein RIT04_230 [Candidatus Parcubacteria bacterium]